MNKKPGFIIVIVVFVTVIVGFYIYLKKQQSPKIDAFAAIPVNAALVAEINNPALFLQEVSQDNRLANQLQELPELALVAKKMLVIDSLLKTNEKLLSDGRDNTLSLSLHEVGNKQFELLYITHLSGRFEANQFFKQLHTSVLNTANLSEGKYNQVKVYTYKNSRSSVFYAYHRGILMASESELLLQDALRQVEVDTGLGSQNGLQNLRKTAGKHADANIYINFNRFDAFYTKLIAAEFLNEREIKHLGEWSVLDLNFKNQTWLINGFTQNTNNPAHFYSLLDSQEPQNLKFIKWVPTGVESFAAFGISNLARFEEQLQKHMAAINQSERHEINQKQLVAVLGPSYEKDLLAIFDHELAQVNYANGSTLFYIRTKGYHDANELIQKWITHYARTEGISKQSLIHECKIDNETKFPIYRFPTTYFPVRMFGPWFKACSATYVTAFDDFLIFGESVHTLSRVIYNNVLQKTMAFDGAYNQYSDFLSNKVNFYAFVSLTGSTGFLNDFLTPDAFAYFKQHQSILRDFYAVSWQIASENNMYYNNFLFRHQPSNKIKAATEWETRLDTTIAFKPQLVVNHYNNEKEILVQDMKNTVYLINKTGRILWKKKLEEPILSEVTQIDYYKNGKLQYLFNTESQIHLLDRNGNFVERYPINLPAKAVNALSIFDYDKRKNYRIFVPTADKQVYCYDIEGRIVTGFNFKGADNPIISPVQYVRDKDKDYLLVTDVSRIYILDRRGNPRIKLNKQFNPSRNNLFEYQAGTATRSGRLIRTDEGGTLYYIYFNGEVESQPIADFSPLHYFKFEDVTGDNIADIVFVDKNKLTVFTVAGKKQYEYTFSTEIMHEPAFYQFSASQTAIGITETGSQKIYLFNSRGKFMDGFPLPGKTRFSIGVLEPGSARFNLVVGGDEQYLFNYKLN